MPLLFLLCTAASCLLPAMGEVVPDFTNCLEFFLDRMPPDTSLAPPGAVRICQFYKNAYRFATMYDKEKHIPVYSAYTCKQGKGPRLDDRTPGEDKGPRFGNGNYHLGEALECFDARTPSPVLLFSLAMFGLLYLL